jgi:hypothetical protein
MAGGQQGAKLEDEGVWRVQEGEIRSVSDSTPYRSDGTENLTYNNPYGITLERVWFDGRMVYAIEADEVELAFDEERRAIGNKVAQEYQVVYAVELDERGQLKDGQEPERVEGQLNIYDSVPGMDAYSPLWQFNYVIVPRGYGPNTLRSEADCLKSGYPVHRSTVVEN